MKRYKKIKMILGMIVVVCIVLSLIYVNVEKDHECSEHSCSICLQIHLAQDLLNNIKAVIIRCFFGMTLYLCVLSISYGIKILRRQRTPVTLKVKLLN